MLLALLCGCQLILPPPRAATPNDGEPGFVFIYSTSRFAKGTIQCDGAELATLKRGRYALVRLDPGNYTLHWRERLYLPVAVTPGSVLFVRLAEPASRLFPMPIWRLEEVARAAAIKEMRKMKYVDGGQIVDRRVLSPDEWTGRYQL
jgi:hypothetical protein